MRLSSAARWVPPASTAVLWAAAVGSVVFWGLRLAAPAATPAYAPIGLPAVAVADPAALARVFGAVHADVPQAPASSRFVLQGVVASPSGGGGIALIAVDGQWPRPYRVGSTVAPGFVLQSVAPRRAVLGASGAAGGVDLALPSLK